MTDTVSRMTDRARILVIDDDPFMRQLTEIHFASAGWIVDLAGGGAEGLARARSVKPDAIVLDFAMPDLSGEEVLAQLRNDPRTAGIPVVVVTAWTSDEQRKRTRALGAAWLEKPVQGPTLVDVLGRLVRAGRRPDPVTTAVVEP
ncbi:hypothetical protein GCM10009116_01580 [Brevundimonas basaltis]